MAFEELLDQVGGLGKFQIFQFFIILPSHMILITHLLLENFTGAIPGHRCWVPILDNNTFSDNDTGILSQDALLRISIPLDSTMKPENCRRFIHPQWQLLHLNGSIPNTSEPDMEPCVDGWVYDRSFFSSTIVTEWDLVCDYQLLKSVAQFIFMTGMLVGGLIYGYLSDRFGRKLVLLWSYLQMAICETSAAFAPTFSIYCSLRFLAGSSSTVVMTNGSMLARFLALFVMSYLSRQVSEMLFMLLAGLSILVNTYVPQEMQTVRVALASVGITVAAAASASLGIHFAELIPTALRGKAAGLEFLASRTGGALAPLLMALTIYFTTLPWIIYGVFPIIAGLSVFFLPETKDLPLIDTIQDVENESLKANGELPEHAKINDMDTFGPGDDDEIQFEDIGDDDEDIDNI
ncbi:Solute carrier family 22 member 10 [Tupaia chinensis]|uniref:Solute carrier family 22 member 10 n=1 Tax=Tupaia chinensis TaxID=246437 RepID=L9JNF7_TUPCH|nr:Solute carrier family 22 member 10 [Tupaia chinensis]